MTMVIGPKKHFRPALSTSPPPCDVHQARHLPKPHNWLLTPCWLTTILSRLQAYRSPFSTNQKRTPASLIILNASHWGIMVGNPDVGAFIHLRLRGDGAASNFTLSWELEQQDLSLTRCMLKSRTCTRPPRSPTYTQSGIDAVNSDRPFAIPILVVLPLKSGLKSGSIPLAGLQSQL
jgi:hypothetical protein